MLVLCLEHGPRRFNELRVPLRSISPKVLSETQRAMERDGLVIRDAYDEQPPRAGVRVRNPGGSPGRRGSCWPP
ncbi:winged helix-turn-helix transcriptional regulator [Asanoa siamensis]|nr:helix-turn-helix domain-containing protein [Asanoa siamensis]